MNYFDRKTAVKQLKVLRKEKQFTEIKCDGQWYDGIIKKHNLFGWYIDNIKLKTDKIEQIQYGLKI